MCVLPVLDAFFTFTGLTFGGSGIIGLTSSFKPDLTSVLDF